MEELKYKAIGPVSKAEVQSILARDLASELSHVVVSVSMFEADAKFAEEVCLHLSDHVHEEVRGNAILGLGHLARRFHRLNDAHCKPALEAAIADQSAYVRGQAWAAADDIAHFLKWQIAGFDGK